MIATLLKMLGVPSWRHGNTLQENISLLKHRIKDLMIWDRFKPLYFLYLDESVNNATNISCVSGIYFPIRKHHAIRKEVYSIHRKIKDELQIQPYGQTPEIHGVELLNSLKYPQINDDFRISIYREMREIVNRHRIKVFRIGYNNAKEIAKFLKSKNQKLYGLHMLGLCSLLNHLTSSHRIIIVMDSTNQDVVDVMSRMIYAQTSDTLMFPERQLSFIMQKPQNILDSIVYVDSKFSELMQLSDVIGYTFNKLDYQRQGKTLSEFSRRIANVCNEINANLITESVVTMQMNPPPT